jgi:hypothetical protein
LFPAQKTHAAQQGTDASPSADDFWVRADGDARFFPAIPTRPIVGVMHCGLRDKEQYQGGVRGLLEFVLEDCPFNPRLKELEKLLRTNQGLR